ncbi:MAG TPA: hypothetical protein IAB56_06560 [Candidatus Scybalousia intestinigallinarum]|nr:hypothetical protein [Candidatus Scybalousia intestinigallinarum]
MEEKQALILFSGGLDSLLTSCKMIEDGWKVTLVHYDNGSSSGCEHVKETAERLIKRYGENKVKFWGVGLTVGYFKALRDEIYRLELQEIVRKYPYFNLPQFTCLACRSAMYVYTILLCRKLNIKVVAEGARKSQLFAIEQTNMLEQYRNLLNAFGIELVTPLLELESDYDRTLELLIRGINPAVIEPQCHFGVPMKKPLSPEEELEVSHIYQEEVKPKCLKLIKMSEKIPLDPSGKLY